MLNTMLSRTRRWLTAAATLVTCLSAWPQSGNVLALQREGQASFYVDRQTATATIVDLGKEGDGDKVMVRIPSADGIGPPQSRPLLEHLAEHEKVKHLVFVCSHPHDDHMGGIAGMFRQPASAFFVNGDEKLRRFESITVVDDGVPDSLAKMYREFEQRSKARGSIKFTQLKVTDASGRPTNAFASLAHLQKGVVIETVPYERSGNAGPHGRSIITLVTLREGADEFRLLDTDDAETKAIESAVRRLQAKGVNHIDALVVPHHGSRQHDVKSVLALNPKWAIFAVNANNRFGHPTAPVLLELMEKLGPANVLFTGSTDDIVLDARGVQRFQHSAAQRDSFHEFVESARKQVLARKPSKERTTELAMFESIRRTMFGETPPDPPPTAFAQARPPGDVPPAQPSPSGPSTPPGTPPSGPSTPSPSKGGGGGGAAHLLKSQIAASGSIHPVGFDSGQIPPAGLDGDQLTALRVFKSPAGRPSDAYPDSFLHSLPYFEPSARFAAKPPPRPGAIPNGGMVFLDGGRVTIQGAYPDMRRASLAACGTKVCLKTPEARHELPFSDLSLLKEVWDKVMAGTDSFYLSINPRKSYLEAGAPGAAVPAGKMRFGTGTPTGSDAHNEVVTAGGIDRSRIGHILWNADVAFKSASLGVDVFTGAKRSTLPGLLQNDDNLFSGEAEEVKIDNRWCRMYWTSGAPRFDFSRPNGIVLVTGDAVVARSEAMRLRNKALEPFPEGTWCSREKRVAASLQRQANSNTGASELRQLRELALMQSFAIWARRSGGANVPFENAPAPAASPPVPQWTSGVRSEPILQVQEESVRASGRDGRVVHVSMTDGAAFERCILPALKARTEEWIRLGIKKDPRTGIWLIGPGQNAEVQRTIQDMSARIAKCGDGVVLPSFVTTELDDSEEGIGSIGLSVHLLSSQIHGGVLLGSADVGGGLRLSDNQLWSPDGKLLYGRLGDELHFWNSRKTASGAAVLQHVVFSKAQAMETHVSEGRLKVLLRVPEIATVRKETRVLPSARAADAAEVLEIYQGDTGVATLQKVVAPCERDSSAGPSPCVEIGDGHAELVVSRIDGAEGKPNSQAMSMKRLSNGQWILEMDLTRLEGFLQAEWDGDRTTNGHLRAASSFRQWGFSRKARVATAAASEAISAESKDVLLLSQAGQDASKIRGVFTAALIESILEGQAVPTNDEAASRAILQLERVAKLAERLPLEVSASLFGSLEATYERMAGAPRLSSAMSSRLVRAASRFGELAESKQALLEGVLPR